MMHTFGDILKDWRIRRGLTLRECSVDLGIDPSNWSKIERGIVPAPNSETTLKKWATYLKLSSDELQTFRDKAALSRNKLPDDIASDQRVLDTLPVFFRAARERKMDDKNLKKFVDKMREAYNP